MLHVREMCRAARTSISVGRMHRQSYVARIFPLPNFAFAFYSYSSTKLPRKESGIIAVAFLVYTDAGLIISRDREPAWSSGVATP